MDVSFSADQLRRVLGSAEGKQLLALLAADGGGRLRQAAEAVKAGDHARAQAILQPVLQTEQAQALLQKLDGCARPPAAPRIGRPCAAAGAAFRQGLIDSDVMVHMPGGKLWTQIDEDWNVKMIGSVKRICKMELFEDFFH